jgi:hypothetical protein
LGPAFEVIFHGLGDPGFPCRETFRGEQILQVPKGDKVFGQCGYPFMSKDRPASTYVKPMFAATPVDSEIRYLA